MSINLTSLNWLQFEHLVGSMYRSLGYEVKQVLKRGRDGGVDLEIQRGGVTTLVQCKRHTTASVSVNSVRELFGVLSLERPDAPASIVTTTDFTDPALAWAKRSGVECMDGKDLLKRLELLDAHALMNGSLAFHLPPRLRHRGSGVRMDTVTDRHDDSNPLFEHMTREELESKSVMEGALAEYVENLVGFAETDLYYHKSATQPRWPFVDDVMNCLLHPAATQWTLLTSTLFTSEVSESGQTDYYYSEDRTCRICRVYSFEPSDLMAEHGIVGPAKSAFSQEDLALLTDFFQHVKNALSDFNTVRRSIRTLCFNEGDTVNMLRIFDRLYNSGFRSQELRRGKWVEVACPWFINSFRIWETNDALGLRLDIDEGWIAQLDDGKLVSNDGLEAQGPIESTT